jgi:hypothetical protein
MITKQQARDTIYLNTAEFPRIRQMQGVEAHHFTVVSFDGTDVCDIESVWVGVARIGSICSIVHSQPLLRRTASDVELWNSFTQEWERHV